LVTGAGGFIGANLVRELLKRGDEVHIISRPESIQWRLTQVADKLRPHNVELNDSEAVLKMVDKIQPEQVFHLAQYGWNSNENDSVMLRKVIIEGSGALFDACTKVKSVKMVINAGSSSEYGAKSAVMEEEMIPQPNTPYGCAKAWVTLYGQHLAREKNVPITTLRLFSVFGPWDAAMHIVPASILACLRSTVLNISDPNAVRDFVFVDDVVRAFLLTAEKKCVGEVINIGFSRQMTLSQMVETILKHTGAKIKVKTGSIGRSFDQPNAMWQANISKAKRILNWNPKFSQEEGIIKTIKWFYENKSLYQNS